MKTKTKKLQKKSFRMVFESFPLDICHNCSRIQMLSFLDFPYFSKTFCLRPNTVDVRNIGVILLLSLEFAKYREFAK